MTPWLGFNGRFVSESFINEDLKTFDELYKETHPKKQHLFWIEYFFANILNRNVSTLLQNKNYYGLEFCLITQMIINIKKLILHIL